MKFKTVKNQKMMGVLKNYSFKDAGGWVVEYCAEDGMDEVIYIKACDGPEAKDLSGRPVAEGEFKDHMPVLFSVNDYGRAGEIEIQLENLEDFNDSDKAVGLQRASARDWNVQRTGYVHQVLSDRCVHLLPLGQTGRVYTMTCDDFNFKPKKGDRVTFYLRGPVKDGTTWPCRVELLQREA